MAISFLGGSIGYDTLRLIGSPKLSSNTAMEIPMFSVKNQSITIIIKL